MNVRGCRAASSARRSVLIWCDCAQQWAEMQTANSMTHAADIRCHLCSSKLLDLVSHPLVPLALLLHLSIWVPSVTCKTHPVLHAAAATGTRMIDCSTPQ